MSCIDVVQRIGLSLQGASFSMIVSAALSSALESFRQNNIIPTRDGFEYEDMMKNYPKQGRAHHARALAITKLFTELGPAVQTPAIAPVDTRKQTRFKELAFRWNTSPENVSEEEQAEMKALVLELNPE